MAVVRQVTYLVVPPPAWSRNLTGKAARRHKERLVQRRGTPRRKGTPQPS